MSVNSITVNQLNNYVKSLIENDVHLTYISVTGEISNFKNHFSSGHWYFTLKDSAASVRCVMFRINAARVKFNVQDGDRVVLRGKVSLYEKDGQYQFYAEEIHPLGDGDLALAFKQVKEKLEKEGLFDESSKRSLVKYPKRIAVITSDTGAAVKDIINILEKRYSLCEVVSCPVNVQGEYAVSNMISALDKVYGLDGIDTIIIGRGGGSAEDLQAFNSEILARKIYESPIPVISAVGHETDFTICDFVADVRASTPSHAAELATPDADEILSRINNLRRIIVNRLKSKYEVSNLRYNSASNRFESLAIDDYFVKKQLSVDACSDKIFASTDMIVADAYLQAARLATRIDALSPLKTMSRGFSVVTKQGKPVKSAYSANIGDEIEIRFLDGKLGCKITDIPERK